MLLIDVVLVGLVVFALVAMASAVFGVMSRPKTNQLISAADLRALRKRDSIAQNALLQIAGNMTDNPVSIAQVALDERNDTYDIKEIN